MKNESQSYDGWHRAVHGDESPASLHLAQWHEDALAVAPPVAGQKVLEVGCGVGDFATHLARQGAVMTAVDFSPAAIELAQARMAANLVQISFSTADAQSLPFADATFDVVFSCECLEHIPDPPQALREMARVLRPGGRLVLTTENYSNAMILAWLMSWWRGEPFNSGTHVQPIEQFFLFWRVRAMMRRAGFAVTQMLGAHHVFLLLPRLHPHTFVRERFRSRFLAAVFRPLARHVTFTAVKE